MCGEYSGAVGQMQLGADVSSVGALSRGVSEFAYSRYQAKAAGADARAELDAAQAQAEKIRRGTRGAVSDARAGVVAAGATLDSGSALTLEQDINQRGESDALTAILTGDRKAANQRRLAAQYRTSGVNALGGSLLRASEAQTKWRGVKPQPSNLDYNPPNERGDY